MYKLSEMIERQREYIQKLKNHDREFINTIDKNKIETILLSGSVSRGDYCPGKNGGMIDLIVVKKKRADITVGEIFGPNQDPYIPFHCVKWNGEWFEILFTDFVDCNKFKEFNESRKFSIMESELLYDPNGKYNNELETIKKSVEEELKDKLKGTIGYLKYIIGKDARWEIRGAYPHIHNNLNIAIELRICCLYYLNGKHAPADDRKLYYTYELGKLPQNYEELLVKLFEQKINSKEDYERRKKLFIEEFIGIMQRI
jgi:predicted nucleotidyltransferase